MIKIITVTIGALLLSACGQDPEPNPPLPKKVCTKHEAQTGFRGGTYYSCIEWELGCIKPLVMVDEPNTGKLSCRLRKE